MLLTKMGYDHVIEMKNCHDTSDIIGTEKALYKIVCDGCGGASSSEVGAKLFIQLFRELGFNIPVIFDRLTSLIRSQKGILDNLLFTVLVVEYKDGLKKVHACGDGYVILINGDKVDYISLEGGEYPEYYAYRYIDIKENHSGVDFNSIDLRIKYVEEDPDVKVGVATDGLRFLFAMPQGLQDEFKTILISDSNIAMKKFINRNHKYFKDDISISI